MLTTGDEASPRASPQNQEYDPICDETPNGKRVSRARRLPPHCDDDQAQNFSQKARVFGVDWTHR
jgi:hypothetical protein